MTTGRPTLTGWVTQTYWRQCFGGMYDRVVVEWEITDFISVGSTQQHAGWATGRHYVIAHFIRQPVLRHTAATTASSHTAGRSLSDVNEDAQCSVHWHGHVDEHAEEIALVWRHIFSRVVDCPATAFGQHHLQQNGQIKEIDTSPVFLPTTNIIYHNAVTTTTKWDDQINHLSQVICQVILRECSCLYFPIRINSNSSLQRFSATT